MNKDNIYTLQFILLIVVSAALTGLASAFFLYSLDFVTNFREDNNWIIYFLPFAGFLISWIYTKYSGEANKGNKLIIQEYHASQNIIPFKMAPLVYFGTIITHLFGGSAGREGTAVQISAAIFDNAKKWISVSEIQRRILLKAAVAAGFSSVFGTPLTAIVFSLEILRTGKQNYVYLPLLFLSSFVAHIVCLLTGIKHSNYLISSIPQISVANIVYLLIAAFVFGLAASLFVWLNPQWKKIFAFIKYPPLQTFVAGALISLFFYFNQSTRYLGLGIPVILQSFSENVLPYDFIIKIALTTFTISLGFKGGEVTPLFFIGATLGNALSQFIPIDFSFLAGIGLVAVFAGATKSPMASAIMALELFGWKYFIIALPVCLIANFISGKKSIYS